MAELRFHFGPMGSGKSTLALQVHQNLTHAGRHGLLLTQLDRLEAAVSSRLGPAEPAIEVTPELDLAALADGVVEDVGSLDFLVCDEAHFYEVAHVEQLAEVVDRLDVDVWAFGLLTDLGGRLFPGTARLLELADVRTQIELSARCWCGRLATHNAAPRRAPDHASSDAPSPMVAGEGAYELLCRRHFTDRGAGPGGGTVAAPVASGPDRGRG